MTITLDQIDLLEDTWAAKVPYDQFEVLREQAPVFWHEHPEYKGFWAVTRFDDVKVIFRDNITFSPSIALEKPTARHIPYRLGRRVSTTRVTIASVRRR